TRSSTPVRAAPTASPSPSTRCGGSPSRCSRRGASATPTWACWWATSARRTRRPPRRSPPAAAAGLRAGDFITDIDGKKMDGAGDVIDYVSTRGIGARVVVGVWRDGKHQPIDVVLGELPSQDGRGGTSGKVGLALQTLTPRLAESLGLDPRTRGAVVAEVAPGGQAAAVGVEEGDVIL